MPNRRAASFAIALASVLFAGAASAEPDTCARSLESASHLREQRRLLVANALYHECSSSPGCTPEARAACATHEAELFRAIPTVTIVIDGDGGRGTLMLDRSPVASGIAFQVDPGPHIVTLVATDGQRREENILVAEHDRARIVMLAPTAAAPAATSTAAPTTTNGPYLVAGAGLLLLLGAATMQTFARVEEADAKSLYRDAWNEESPSLSQLYSDAARSHHDAAEVNQGFAITLATLGAITVAVGVTWWVTSRTSRSGERAPTTSLSKNPLRISF